MVFRVNNGSEWFYFWLLVYWTSLFGSEWTSSIVNKANWQWEKIVSIPVRRLLVWALLMAMKRTVTPLTPWRSKLTSMPRKRKTREVANIRIKKDHTTTTSKGMKKYARKWCVSLCSILFCLRSHHTISPLIDSFACFSKKENDLSAARAWMYGSYYLPFGKCVAIRVPVSWNSLFYYT